VSRAACALVALVVAACGPDAGEYPFERTERCTTDCDAGTDAGPADAGPPVIPDEPLEDWDTTDAGPLSGIFAVEVTIEAKVVVEVQARLLMRLRVLQRDGWVRMKTQPCRIDLPAVEGVAVLSIPPPLERVIQREVVEAEGDFLSGDPLAFDPPPAVMVFGADLADEATDPLPTTDDLATAADEDEDGHPGVTVDAETVLCRQPERAYLALRAIAGLSGTIDPADDYESFAGDVDPELEWSILGVTHDCLAAAAELEIEILEGSRFTALRVGDAQDIDENGNVSCPELAVHAEALFGEHWAR